MAGPLELGRIWRPWRARRGGGRPLLQRASPARSAPAAAAMAPRELQGAATDGAGDGAEPAQGRRGGRGRRSSISPAPQLRPPMEPRRAALGSVHPWSSAAGLAGLRRAGGGQARRPPSPSPAPPPSRAPAVALCSPSSSVRGRGAATLPCSLGGERGRRSAARAAGEGGLLRASAGARFESAAGLLPGELQIGGGPPPPRRASNRRRNRRWARPRPAAPPPRAQGASRARREAGEGRSPTEAKQGWGAAPPVPAGSREERPRRSARPPSPRPRRSARARAELLRHEPSSSSRRSGGPP